MAKRLTEKQKEEMIKSFTNGVTVEILSQKFNCIKSTIVRNLKKHLGDLKYKELIKENKNSQTIFKIQEKKRQVANVLEISNENVSEADFSPSTSFIELTPLEYEIENVPRKDFSSIPISDVEFPQIVYMIVNKQIELEVKLLKDYPEWEFLPPDDMNRKTISIFSDLKTAKRFCNKEQKVIKVPNTNVFKIAAPILLSRGITRIINDEKLISL